MRNSISSFVCWAGGADLSILKECPEERSKFESIGMGVIITALLSGVSISFALYSLFTDGFPNKNQILGGFIVFWMIIIFCIDWSLVKTMHKKEKMSFIDWSKYMTGVIFRFLVAGAISFTVTKPLEVKLFQSRLEPEVLKNKLNVFKDENTKMEQGVRSDSSTLATTQITVEDLRNEKKAGCQDPTYITLVGEISKLEGEKAASETKLKSLRNTNTWLYNRADCITYDANGQRVGLTPDCANQYNRNSISIASAESKIQKIKEKISEKRQNAKEIYDEWLKDLESQQSAAVDARTAAQAQYSENQKGRNSQTKEQNEKLESYKPNLMTYIEAIHTLEKRNEGRYVFYTRWLLFLVILLIDTAPVVIKLLSKRGIYEQIFERIEYERKAQQEQLRHLAEKEKSANENLINDVEAVQRHLLREAMEHYYEDEHKNMATRFKDYISTEQKDNQNG